MARSVRPLRLVVAVAAVTVVSFGFVGCVADPPPVIGTASAGHGQATVSWQAPLAAPFPVVAYAVRPWIGQSPQTPVRFNSTATTQTVTGLTNGTTYTFTVVAINTLGNGSASSGMSNPVTPTTALGLYGWGDNGDGALGDGTTTNRFTPVQVGTATDWASVSAGAHYTAAVKTDGTLWAWGDNGRGQLGDGTTTSHSSPVQVGTATDWAIVAAGASHTGAVKTDGTLWAWGGNFGGQLGDGTTTERHTPVQVGAATDWASVAAGDVHTVAVKTDGTLWVWGANDRGQLGVGTSGGFSPSPLHVGTATDWASVAAGYAHTVAVKTDGTLWAWGDNTYGQLGDGTSTNQPSPVQVGAATNWASVAAGSLHTVTVKTDGTLWAWGLNNAGQLGDGSVGDEDPHGTPLQVGAATNWASAAAGQEHTVAVKTDGTLWAWGRNNEGELGVGGGNSQSSPVEVGTATNWTSVTAGDFHTIALAAS